MADDRDIEAIESYFDWKSDRRERLEATKKLRRDLAMEIGTELAHIKCPVCGMNKVLRQGREKEINIPYIKFSEGDYLIQYKKGGGKANPRDIEKALDIPATRFQEVPGVGIGFWWIDKGLTLSQVKSEYPEIFEKLKRSIDNAKSLIEKA